MGQPAARGRLWTGQGVGWPLCSHLPPAPRKPASGWPPRGQQVSHHMGGEPGHQYDTAILRGTGFYPRGLGFKEGKGDVTSSRWGPRVEGEDFQPGSREPGPWGSSARVFQHVTHTCPSTLRSPSTHVISCPSQQPPGPVLLRDCVSLYLHLLLYETGS